MCESHYRHIPLGVYMYVFAYCQHGSLLCRYPCDVFVTVTTYEVLQGVYRVLVLHTMLVYYWRDHVSPLGAACLLLVAIKPSGSQLAASVETAGEAPLLYTLACATCLGIL